jgi:hypothetical protein
MEDDQVVEHLWVEADGPFAGPPAVGKRPDRPLGVVTAASENNVDRDWGAHGFLPPRRTLHAVNERRRGRHVAERLAQGTECSAEYSRQVVTLSYTTMRNLVGHRAVTAGHGRADPLSVTTRRVGSTGRCVRAGAADI